MSFLDIYNSQKEFFKTNKTKSYDFRIKQLKLLKKILKENESDILNALNKDLGKSSQEAYMTELGIVIKELNYVLKNLKKWVKNKTVKTSLINFKSKGFISYEPYGISLIVTPWNYPINLSLIPLIYSISAGNCVILKMSNNSFYTSSIIKEIFKSNFKSNYIYVLYDKKETKDLLTYKYDHIFFTGGLETGKLFLKNARDNLTPIQLELGGKSPVIIDRDVNIEKACKRIIWGKIINSGQTCVAPDYLLVPRYNKTKVINCLKKYIDLFASNALNNSNYPKIINNKEFLRLLEILKEGRIIYGGSYDAEKLKIEPTLLSVINLKEKSMKEEIFGPILPIIVYEDLNDAIKIINENNPNPLALYLFTKNKKVIKKVLNEVSFGGGCINDTLMHLTEHNLPFGGVKESGMGRYHGKIGFINFSNERSILNKSTTIDINLRYPPFNDKKKKVIKKVIGG